MGDRPPAPICGAELGSTWIDEGTMCLWQSTAPGPTGTNTFNLDTESKIREAITRALPLLPADVAHQIEAMLSPASLGIIAGTLLVWAGSHFFGIGEIVDVILLGVGFAMLGMSAYSGASELYEFATLAIHAQTEADLDRAAQHFAHAVSIIGVAIVTALLLRRNVRAVEGRPPPGGPLSEPGLLEPGPAPPLDVKPIITRPFTLPSGNLGETDWYGNIAVIRNQSIAEQRVTLYHEWIHSVLSPRIAPLRQLRAALSRSAYERSALMKYLEEALAQSYGMLKVHGLQAAFSGVVFPVVRGYVTVSQLAAEGTAIGTVTIGGAQFTVYVTEGEIKAPSP